jgi:hypothetical protein
MAPDKQPLSDAWRINKSNIRAIEMANALRALRKVIGAVDPESRYKSITFNSSTQSLNRKQEVIKIDPTFAVKSAPIEPDDFDVLCGHAIHEAGHTLANSDAIFGYGVATSTHKGIADLKTDHNVVTYDAVATIGEEIYVDNLFRSGNPVLGDYIQRARKAYQVPREAINWADVIAAWTAVGVYGHLPNPESPTRILSALKVCMELTQQLRTHDLTAGTRKKLYQTATEKLNKILAEDEIRKQLSKQDPDQLYDEKAKVQDNATEKYDQDSSTDTNAGSEDLDKLIKGMEAQPENTLTEVPSKPLLPSHSTGKISEALAEEIESLIETQTEDITKEVQDLVQNHGSSAQVLDTTWSQSRAEETSDIDDRLYQDLVWIQHLKNSIGTEVFRSEPRGIIDGRRLHRAPIDGLVFKQKRRRPRKDLDLVLLLDASSSMGRSSNPVYVAANTLHKIIPESTVLTYDQSYSGVNIQVASAKHGPSRRVRPIGSTPSGTALIATAQRFPESLIVHFTDGDANQGVDPQLAYDIIAKQFPKASFIEVQLRKRPTRQGYPDWVKVVNIRSLDEFAPLLREAVKPWALG